MNWFLPLYLITSLFVRTPHTQPNPFDYEFSFGVEKTDQLYLNRQWERELGSYYVDEEYWTAHQWKKLYVRDRYVREESHGIEFNRTDIRLKDGGWSLGYSVRTNDLEHNLVAGYGYDKRFNYFVANGQLTVRTEIYTDFQPGFLSAMDYVLYTKIKFGLLKNLDLAFEIDSERIDGKTLFKSGIKLEVEMPTIKGGL